MKTKILTIIATFMLVAGMCHAQSQFSGGGGSGSGGPPSGTAGGDLGGTYPNPTVVSIADVNTGVLPAANGGTAKVSTAGQGYFISDGRFSSFEGLTTSAAATGAANAVSVVQFTLLASVTVSHVSVTIVGTNSGTLLSVGIYSADGTTKLIDSGTFSTTAAATLTNTITPVTLAPGVYWFAQTCNSATPTAASLSNTAGTPTFQLLNANVKRVGTAPNASTAGVLPSGLGTLSSISSTAVNMTAAVFEP